MVAHVGDDELGETVRRAIVDAMIVMRVVPIDAGKRVGVEPVDAAAISLLHQPDSLVVQNLVQIVLHVSDLFSCSRR